MDPSKSARLLVATGQVYETTNSGFSWSAISSVLSQDPQNNPFVVAIGIAPSDGNTVYASTQDGHLWVTQNDGVKWTEYDKGLSGVVVDLRIDPSTPDHLFAVTGSAVWHLPSGGLPSGGGWVNITGTIPNNLSFSSIFVDWRPATPTLFVGTNRGLYISFDLGATWTKWGPGLPNVQISDVQGEVLNWGYLLLAVATYGRGAWEILIKPSLILNRHPISQDEVAARRKQPRGSKGGLPIQDAFRVVVDGFSAKQLGLTGPGSTLPNLPTLSPGTGIIITPSAIANTSENGDYLSEFQRFTFYYDIDFPDDSAFNFNTHTQDLTLSVTGAGAPASALLTLIKQPDPFLLHGGDPALSVDLQVFVVQANETKWPGLTMGPDASAAPGFIQQVIANITLAQFDALQQTDEETSRVYVSPTDGNTPVFNFALAKVHYIGLTDAPNVRVFFRLFQALWTTAMFDPSTTYRRTVNPSGQPIPLAGIDIFGDAYVTIPCFAAARIDSTVQSMSEQSDNFNIHTFVANPDGSEVDHFYGCWLDINQPFKPDGKTPNNVLPIGVDPFNPTDGPFFTNSPYYPPFPVQQFMRGLNPLVIAEIAFDQTPIPLGKDPSNWDKLAQRNIAWSDAGSAQSVTTFEIRPTPAGLPPIQPPDELMIDWNNIPADTTAQIYLPAVDVETILGMANRMYSSHRLTRLDSHTLQCKTGGVSYIPIAPGSSLNYGGLLTVDLPEMLPQGEVFNVVVRQLTNAFGSAVPPPPPPPRIAARRARHSAPVVAAPVVGAPAELEWRRVLGAFQLTIPVRNKGELLVREERELSVLRWIAEAIPYDNRWYPVFRRYLDQIAGRVKVFGGDPTEILPSPTGEGRRKLRHEEGEGEERIAFTGKIVGLIFDRFGDFEGFLLDTEDGERKFFNREKEIEELAERAWRERLRITVWVECDEPHRPASIIIREPPAPFAG